LADFHIARRSGEPGFKLYLITDGVSGELFLQNLSKCRRLNDDSRWSMELDHGLHNRRMLQRWKLFCQVDLKLRRTCHKDSLSSHWPGANSSVLKSCVTSSSTIEYSVVT
jgi:hypothetical protein